MSSVTREVVCEVWLCREGLRRQPESTAGRLRGHPAAPSVNTHRKDQQRRAQEDLTGWGMGKGEHIPKTPSCSNGSSRQPRNEAATEPWPVRLKHRRVALLTLHKTTLTRRRSSVGSDKPSSTAGPLLCRRGGLLPPARARWGKDCLGTREEEEDQWARGRPGRAFDGRGRGGVAQPWG